jgi:hypothetical protein
VLHTPVLAFSVIAAMVVSYLFYARERMHSHHLAALAAERLASETQLKLLQSQLEPHMLFNTLANLRVLIGLDPPQAQAMLDHLIAFLRTTLAATRADRHPLATEFDALRDYLALMAVRMGPRLQWQLDLPDALRAAGRATAAAAAAGGKRHQARAGAQGRGRPHRGRGAAPGPGTAAARARHRRRPGRAPGAGRHGLRAGPGAPAAGRLYGERRS